MSYETAKVGKRGTIVIPAALRKRYGIEDGSQLILEALPQGVLLRPVVTLPIEIYSRERKAEFLLNNTVNEEEYDLAVEAVREMGLDPESIPHTRP